MTRKTKFNFGAIPRGHPFATNLLLGEELYGLTKASKLIALLKL